MSTSWQSTLVLSSLQQPSQQQQNDTTDDWWSDAEDVTPLLIPSGDELAFVPPPPRPSLFALDELGSEAFTATCDLCSWAWRDSEANKSASPSMAYGELGWALMLIIVALLSAVIGAVVMVTVLHCRKLKGMGNSAGCCTSMADEDRRHRPSIPMTPEHQNPLHSDDTNKTPPLPDSLNPHPGFWRRLLHTKTRTTNNRCCDNSLQRRPPRRLCPPAPPINENHYTVTDRCGMEHMEEALYAELEQDPAYQNTGYQLSDLDSFEPPPSAPSSAYYSDLSCGADRTYESVGDDVWGPIDLDNYRTIIVSGTPHEYNDLVFSSCRMNSITKTVPSDYV